MSLSHHHPDNLSYILVDGKEYITCEDGYNRNILAANHNLLLVDGRFTDAEDCNDVYMDSVTKRLEADPTFNPAVDYRGSLDSFYTDQKVTLFSAETTSMYPPDLHMRNVSRFVFTSELDFILLIGTFASDVSHAYSIVSNTDSRAERLKEGGYAYSQGSATYTVLSDKEIAPSWQENSIVSVMTTQEPDKVCEVHQHCLIHTSVTKQTRQTFVECISFLQGALDITYEDGVVTVNTGTVYEFIFPERFSDYAMQSDAPLVCIVREGEKKHLYYWK